MIFPFIFFPYCNIAGFQGSSSTFFTLKQIHTQQVGERDVTIMRMRDDESRNEERLRHELLEELQETTVAGALKQQESELNVVFKEKEAHMKKLFGEKVTSFVDTHILFYTAALSELQWTYFIWNPVLHNKMNNSGLDFGGPQNLTNLE